MELVYTASSEQTAISAARDLMELIAPADAILAIHEVFVGNLDNETNEQLPIRLKMAVGTYTSGSGGGTVTPAPHMNGAPASGATAEEDNTTQASAGTGSLTIIHRRPEASLNGWLWTFPEADRLIISPTDALIVALDTAPTSLGLAWYVTFGELGG